MSIVVAHGYSMMYATQKQGTPDGPLSQAVTPMPFKAATYGKIAPSTKAELDQYSSGNAPEGDFDTSQIDDADWNDEWPVVCWTKVGSRYYTWDGNSWEPALITSGLVIDAADGGIGSPANELLFVGRYPQSKSELDSVEALVEDPEGGTMTSPYFATNKYVCLKGQGVGDQYFWNGTEWLPGVSDD